ncbi:hypothetical protein C1H76_6545 [Elsinoe australis]|uniref:Uncharacterized protein n=1 Tax=Elsinoe australis TaxID=40998 RepID=A0A4U7AXB3_9PEZI|nr:hypothetical protein C1H76_6545 [Elsinoe australis]
MGPHSLFSWVFLAISIANTLAQGTNTNAQQWPSASTLIVEATTCTLINVPCSNPTATYTAARVNETRLWNVTIPTKIRNSISPLTVDPLGYYWAGPSGTPRSLLPTIPINAPHAYPNGLVFACDAVGICSMGARGDTVARSTMGLSSSLTAIEPVSPGPSTSAPVASSTILGSSFNTELSNGTIKTIDTLMDSSITGFTATLSLSTSFSTETLSTTTSDTAGSLNTSLPSKPTTSLITVGPSTPISSISQITSPSSTASAPKVPFGVFVTTISGSSYTLTFVSSTATGHSTAVETISGTTTTNTITPGAAIWVVPTLPPLFPQDVGNVGPPPGAPKPLKGGSSSPNLLCLFGCGPGDSSGKSGGGSSFPCIINCDAGGGGGGGGRGGGGGGGSSNGKPTNSVPSQTIIKSSTDLSELSESSTSSCTTTAVPTCDETVFLTTSFYSDSSTSTVISSTSTTCVTITACDARATTATVTSSTSTSESEYVCAPTACAGACISKRSPIGPVPTDTYKRLVALADTADEDEGHLVGRDLPAPSSDETIDKFIGDIFETGQVYGAGAGGPPLANFDENVGVEPTSRFDAFADLPFSSGVDGLYGCISVVVVSRKGVWTSHFWQETFTKTFDGGQALLDQFQNFVISPLSKSRPGFIALTDVPDNAFAETEHPQLLIFYPNLQGNPQTRQVNAILDEVKRLVPGIRGEASPIWSYDRDYRVKQEIKGLAKGKIITNYDPRANAAGARGFQTWAQTDVAMQDVWGVDCNSGDHQKRQAAGICSLTSIRGMTTSSRMTTLTTSIVSSTTELQKTVSQDTASSPRRTAMTDTTSIKGTAGSTTSTQLCYPYQNPRAGPDKQGCQCNGIAGLVPYLSNSASSTPFNICGYTALPTLTTTSVPPFTSTDFRNGFVYSCASSSYYNMAVNTILDCAGSSTVVSTVMTIYTAYAASSASLASADSASSASSSSSASAASAASASEAAAASSATAAAKPKAKCLIWDSISHYTLQVYDIKGWGGDGSSLLGEEKGCGALTAWTWETGCDGETSQASFTLPFLIKAGCVERAIRSAGGPAGLNCEGAGMALTGTEDKEPCHSTGMTLGALIEKGMNLQRKMKTSDLMVANKAAAADDQLGAGNALSATTTHILAQPGNTAAAAALAASSIPASASATTTSMW